MTLTVTNSMLDFAASLGEDWARVLMRNLSDGTLIDMGEAMKYITCPTHPGRIIENHACGICGNPKAVPEGREPFKHAWLGDREEKPIVRPGQLDFDSLVQLEMLP